MLLLDSVLLLVPPPLSVSPLESTSSTPRGSRGYPEGSWDGIVSGIVSQNSFARRPQPQHTTKLQKGRDGDIHTICGPRVHRLVSFLQGRMKRSMSVIDLPSLCRGLDFEAPRKKCNSDATLSTIVKVGLGDLTSLTDMFSCSLSTTPRKRLTTYFNENCSENNASDDENSDITCHQQDTSCFDSLPAKSKQKLERFDDMLNVSRRRGIEEDDEENCLIYLPNN